MSMQLNKSCQ